MSDHSNSATELLTAAVATLESNESVIDLDLILRSLQLARRELERADSTTDDYRSLRQDCEDRIAGMIKATAAVTASADLMAAALAEIDELSTLSVDALLTRYRRVSARFRDAFPQSFRHSRSASTRPSDPSVYR